MIWYKSIMLRFTLDVVQLKTDRGPSTTLLRPAFTLVALSVLDKEGVLVPLVSGLVTSFCLSLVLAEDIHSGPIAMLTGTPHGLTGLTLPFDLPRPPP
jgi:hypothetical protein